MAAIEEAELISDQIEEVLHQIIIDGYSGTKKSLKNYIWNQIDKVLRNGFIRIEELRKKVFQRVDPMKRNDMKVGVQKVIHKFKKELQIKAKQAFDEAVNYFDGYKSIYDDLNYNIDINIIKTSSNHQLITSANITFN
ncbi:uncharacterized protein LOC128952842 [Oppia nitens]|uniref:uncharacterized protein LOC128952842 n=1 Tax=Oppia nitens TaxID=1686743 RepID=UPI0023DCDE53|nr:uncharacterized protein LOC128952842 [Oppia nitens]